MRTTITLEDDVAAALAQLRRDRSIGLSQAINELIRAGLTAKRPHPPFQQSSQSIGLLIDVTNVAEALELLEGPSAR
jgi:Ribbon-helix-helix protein, copG family